VEKYTRVFSFMFEIFGLAGKNKTLLKPIWYNLAIAVPVNVALAVLYGTVKNAHLSYVILAVGVTALYFIDYFCNALAASLIYDEVTTGHATMDKAFANTKRSAGGILTFAAISGLFDLLASYAQERDDVLGKILTQVVHAVWTTATYVIMPAMVIEGLSFGAAFGRSKELMKQDPTNVGSGVIGMAMANWAINLVCMGLAYSGMNVLARFNPIVGAVFFFTLFNLSWALSGFLKISYFTCFYLWARECEKKGAADPKFAPAPLAHALGVK